MVEVLDYDPRAVEEVDIKPPGHLNKATKEWFEEVARSYELEPHHVKLLTLAAEAWDRGQEARRTLKREGTYYKDRYGCPKAHPAVAVERDSRIVFARLLRELALDVSMPDDPRPPRIGGGK